MIASDRLLTQIMKFRAEMAEIAIIGPDDERDFAAVICGCLDTARINLYAGQSNYTKVNAIIAALERQAKNPNEIQSVPK